MTDDEHRLRSARIKQEGKVHKGLSRANLVRYFIKNIALN